MEKLPTCLIFAAIALLVVRGGIHLDSMHRLSGWGTEAASLILLLVAWLALLSKGG